MPVTGIDNLSVADRNTNKMAMSIHTILFLAVIGFVASQEVGELNINVLYKPDKCSRTAKSGDYLTVTYEAFLPDQSGNEQFDNSNNKQPVNFRLNDPESTAMKGWHQGLDGACVEERREVLIPGGELTMNHKLPNTQAPPEGKDVGYRFEVRKIQDKPPSENLFKKMDYDEDKEISKDEIKKFLSESGMGGMDKYETHEEAIDHMFEQIDKDRSGTISHDEFPGPKHDEF